MSVCVRVCVCIPGYIIATEHTAKEQKYLEGMNEEWLGEEQTVIENTEGNIEDLRNEVHYSDLCIDPRKSLQESKKSLTVGTL